MAYLEFEKFFSTETDGESGIVTLTLAKAGDKYNTFDPEFVGYLKVLLEGYFENNSIRALIVTGKGRVFSTGADVSGQFPHLDPLGARHFSVMGQRVFQMLEDAPFVTCAAINGFALGGGFELALACNFRTISSRARVGLPEIDLGLMPGWGGTQRLPGIVGRDMALEMILSGSIKTASEALELGLVSRVFPPQELIEGTKQFLSMFATKSRTAVTIAKRAILGGLKLGIDEGLKLEAELFGLIWTSPDREEGVKAFLEKRKPKFGS